MHTRSEDDIENVLEKRDYLKDLQSTRVDSRSAIINFAAKRLHGRRETAFDASSSLRCDIEKISLLFHAQLPLFLMDVFDVS